MANLRHLKFVAHDVVDFEHFEELGEIADSGPADFKDRHDNSVTIEQGNIDFVITGRGFDYLGGVPIDGRLTGIDIFVDNSLAYEFSRFSMSVEEAFDLFDRRSEKLVTKLFDGDNRIVGSDFADTLPGFHGDDRITGGLGDDTVKGKSGDDKVSGGEGNDQLFGNGGDDRFVFDTALNAATNVDRVMDFKSGKDEIGLEASIFVGLSESGGQLDASQFFAGGVAQSPEHRIIYDAASGALSYDADGNGPTAAVRFASLDAGAARGAGDILLT